MNSKSILLLAVLLCAPGLMSLTANAGAAEAAAEETAPPERTESADGDEAPASEVFIPTEEISEDFAVSFPVDI